MHFGCQDKATGNILCVVVEKDCCTVCDLHDVPGDKDAEEAVTDWGSESQIISVNVNLYSPLQDGFCRL